MGPCSTDVFFLLVLNLFYSFTEAFNEIFKVPRGPNIFQGVWGVQILISIKTYIICDFRGGLDSLSPPPLDPRMGLDVIVVFTLDIFVTRLYR